MFCHRCGKKSLTEAKFCHKCGTKIISMEGSNIEPFMQSNAPIKTNSASLGVNKAKQMIRMISLKHVLYTAIFVIVAVFIFKVNYFYYTGSIFVPGITNRKAQYFTQEEVYRSQMHQFVREDNLIRSIARDAYIVLFTDASRSDNILVLNISNLSEESTSARILFAHEGETFTEVNSVRFYLNNGYNIVHLPLFGFDRLRLCLAGTPNISMVINEVMLTNHFLPPQFWARLWINIIVQLIPSAIVLFSIIFNPTIAKRDRNKTNGDAIKSNAIQERLADKALYGVATLIIPCIFLFNLYNRNKIQNHLPFAQTVVIAVVFAAIGMIVFSMIYFFVRCFKGSMLITLLLWLIFWFYGAINDIWGNVSDTLSSLTLHSILVVVLVFTCVYVRLYRTRFIGVRPVFHTLALCLIVMFAINVAPALRNEIQLAISRARVQDGGGGIYLKRDFNIDPTLPTPDIYWFLMDGMMSLSMVENTFGASQDHLRLELYNRGFVIYEDAFFSGGSTRISVPFLLSPSFYDAYIYSRFGTRDIYAESLWRPRINHMLTQNGLVLVDDIIPYYELFKAFRTIDSNIIMIAFDYYVYTHAPVDIFYDLGNLRFPLGYVDDVTLSISRWQRFLLESGELFELLTLSTPLAIMADTVVIPPLYLQWSPIQNHNEIVDALSYNTLNTWLERQLYRLLIDSLSVPSPKVVFVANNLAHPAHWHHHDTTLTAMDLTRVDLYMQAYDYAAITMLNSIDIVLNNNPNAVIVLQSDHGIHSPETRSHMLTLGYTEDELLEINLSVLSAVRIPPQYGGLDAPLHPLNITRELVNRFVGENYTLLP